MNTIKLNTIGDSPVVVKKGSQVQSQEKTVEITENGTTEVVPDSGYALSKVTVNTNVQGGGESSLEYLDVSGNSKMQSYYNAAILIKSTENGGMIIPAGMGNSGYDSSKFVAYGIDLNLQIYNSSTGLTTVGDMLNLFGITEEELAAIPRITKEEFYAL